MPHKSPAVCYDTRVYEKFSTAWQSKGFNEDQKRSGNCFIQNVMFAVRLVGIDLI